MIAKALLKREKSAHINSCAKTQLYFKSVQRQLRGESITYLLLQGWQLVTRITLSSVSCTCTIEVSLQQALGKKLTSKTIKLITQLQIHLHMDSCIPTPVPTHKQSCVSCSFAEHPGASWWAVYMRVADPALLPLPAPGRTDRRAKTGYFAKLRWHNCVPSCSMATHQALCSQHCWGKN